MQVIFTKIKQAEQAKEKAERTPLFPFLELFTVAIFTLWIKGQLKKACAYFLRILLRGW